MADYNSSYTGAEIDAAIAKVDNIEENATADQTGSEIKTAYESESNTNAYTDAEKAKLTSVEENADVTDATNVDAAGAVMNTDTTTSAMSFVIDEDDMSSNLNTKIPTQQSVKAYADTKLKSDPTGVTGADAVTNIMSLTQAEYDAIGTPNSSTLYFITT